MDTSDNPLSRRRALGLFAAATGAGGGALAAEGYLPASEVEVPTQGTVNMVGGSASRTTLSAESLASLESLQPMPGQTAIVSEEGNGGLFCFRHDDLIPRCIDQYPCAH